MKRRWINLLLVAGIFGLIMGSCNYDYIVYPEGPPVDTNKVYSFKDDVVGIFAATNCTNCHPSSGGLDLTEANAYTSIWDNDLIDTADAENSKIWYYPHPTIGTHGAKYSAADPRVGNMLEWIKQGAKDN